MRINTLISHMSKSTFKVVTVNKYKIDAGSSGMYTTKDFAGIIFPISGSAEFKINGSPYIIREGYILHGCANSEMFKRVIGDESWEYILILYEIFNEPNDLKICDEHFELNIGDSAIIKELLYKIYETNKRPEDMAIFETNTLFRHILKEVFLRCKSHSNDIEMLYNMALEHIQYNYMNEISVNDIAEVVKINENRLLYIFKKYCGIGIKEYIVNFRINVAKELLSTTDMKVNEIAMKVGYQDQFYFSRIFKSRCGVSPLKYRIENDV